MNEPGDRTAEDLPGDFDRPGPPAHPPRFRRRPPAPPVARGWRWGFPAIVLVAVVWAGVLVLDGLETVLQSEEGKTREAVTDQAAPGFEAFVEQTWSMLIVTEDDAGELVQVAVLAVADRLNGGGTLLLIPPGLTTDGCDKSPCRLVDRHRSGGVEADRSVVTDLLDVDVTGTALLTPARWSSLADPVSPLPISLPSDLIQTGADGTTVVRFAAGDGSLEAADIVDLLGFGDAGGMGRLGLQVMFWESWLSTLGRGGDPAVNLPTLDLEVVRIMAVVAAGPVRIEASPWVDDGSSTRAAPGEIQRLKNEMFPFPISLQPGARPTVRLLNGTGDPALDVVAREVVLATGVDIAVVGNFRNFDVIQTRVIHRDPTMADAAAVLAVALGAGVIHDEMASPVADLTVVIGADFAGPAR